MAHGHLSIINGDELFVFGSNKNLSLGVGDEDDRQYPERIHLKRPAQLVHRFYEDYLDHQDIEASATLPDLSAIPTLVRNRPLVIQDVVMAKLSSAILTADPVSNLYVCGVGRGGRLGLGDENTQFKFVPVQGPLADKKVRQVALGQNHTMAVAGNGELWTWGLNSESQLGYALPPPMKADEEPMSLIPRQIFGSLKKEIILGVAASSHHSVAHTGTSLYCWGKNVGQLALMDADSRSLEVQHTPRKVAASLLSAPIEMVSAIDKATTCLLSNRTVWIFAHYGYNLVKFPFPDVFTNHNLTATSFSNHYDPGRRDIKYITSGGDTIAAVSTRGDLFTMQLNHRGDLGQPAASTTNPVKIKGAISQPLCIWDSRKDGVASVDVGEHGSVIICTDSGAVWKRVKRTKGKSAGFGDFNDVRRKDFFKFQRVPCITNCVAVRSSIFGAFAAIRKNSKVMSEEITISDQTLWEDIGGLLCLRDFVSSEASSKIKESRRPWYTAITRERPGSVPYEILRSTDIENDLQHWLQVNSFQYSDCDVDICTSSLPDLRIPVHGWVLAGRSSILREALFEFRMTGSVNTDAFSINLHQGKTLLVLFEADLFSILNLMTYLYQDKIIPVWKYTREAPPSAFRFRQVRTELMKIATRLSMPKLEAAVRLQASLEPSLDADFKEAISHNDFFEGGDVIIELEDEEVELHSQLICKRCPFFEGMFHGRSQGQWLAGRRMELEEKVRIDLKHVSPETFEYVTSFLYADVGSELFNDITTDSLDELSDVVLDVMSVANELMLDRLSQICQALIGKFVTTRNISNLLNEISPCSVSEFKDAGLEYICLQLESMLENHLLDDLDEDLLLELDEMVRDNQLARLPFARSGRAELLLHEKYPTLAGDIDEERQARVRDMAYKLSQKEDERRLSSSYKARFGSLDDFTPISTPDTVRRKSKGGRNEPFSPSLRPRKSQGDLIFDMEEDVSILDNPSSPPNESLGSRLATDATIISQLPQNLRESKGKERAEYIHSPSPSSTLPESLPFNLRPSNSRTEVPLGTSIPNSGSPWAPPTLATSKLDLRDIMSEASSKSALTAGLTEQKTKEAATNRTQTKVSQKERKKQLQQQAAAEAAAKEEQVNQTPWEKVPAGARPAPWKAASPAPKTSLKDAMVSESRMPRAVSANAKPLVASETTPKSTPRRTASPDTRFPGQGRTSSSPAVTAGTANPAKKPLVPHSKSYIKTTPKSEPMLGLSLADIIGQQKREQEMVKEAVAKRSLQEIQQEQAFQEWWDQESRRAQEEEARKKNRSKEKEDKGPRRNRRGRGGKAKSSEGKISEAVQSGQGGNPSAGAKTSTRGGASSSSTRGKGVRGRGGNKS